jgi:hypothetical protein
VAAKVRQKWGRNRRFALVHGVSKTSPKGHQNIADLSGAWGIGMKLLFGTLQFAKRCEARTRQGGRCQNPPMQLGGRCRMHGGASLRGEQHPRYKHGRYSKYRPIDLDELIARCAAMPAPDLSELLADPDPLANLLADFDLSDVL